mgnify:CR=1 FL=1
MPDTSFVPRAETLAKYYDLRHGAYKLDVPFYEHIASETTGIALELGCGTGRLLAPLCRQGLAVIGVDSAQPMLVRAKTAIVHAQVEAQALLVQADLRRPVARNASLAILAMNTFCHFQDQHDQRAVLRSAAESLHKGGMLAMDVPNPHIELQARPNGACILEAVHQVGQEAVYEWSVTEAEPSQQLLRVTGIYDTCSASGMFRREVASYSLRLFYRYELELLIQGAGLKIEAILGDYDYSEYEAESPRMVVIARKE